MPKFLVEIVDDDDDEDPWEWFIGWVLAFFAVLVIVGGLLVGGAGIVMVLVALFLLGRFWRFRVEIVTWSWRISRTLASWSWRNSRTLASWILKISRTLASWIWRNSKKIAAFLRKTWKRKRAGE